MIDKAMRSAAQTRNVFLEAHQISRQSKTLRETFFCVTFFSRILKPRELIYYIAKTIKVGFLDFN